MPTLSSPGALVENLVCVELSIVFYLVDVFTQYANTRNLPSRKQTLVRKLSPSAEMEKEWGDNVVRNPEDLSIWLGYTDRVLISDEAI